MAFSDKDITIRFTVDAEGAVRDVQQADDALRGFGGAAVVANQSLELVQKGFEALRGVAKIAIKGLEQGAQINDVSEAFSNLAEKAGTTADVFLQKLNKATYETVDNFTLMRSANEALKANLTPEQFETVARAAKLFADQTGGDTVEQMNSLTRALATGREGFLKLQGVTIDAAQAAEDFKQKYNLTGELNDQGQLLANQEAAIRALNQKLDEAGTKAPGAGDNLEQLNKILADAKNQFMAAFEGSDAVRQSLSELKDTFKQIDFGAITAGLVGFINTAIKSLKYLKEFVLTLKDIATFNFSGGLQRQMEQLAKSEAEYAKAHEDEAKLAVEGWKGQENALDGFSKKYYDYIRTIPKGTAAVKETGTTGVDSFIKVSAKVKETTADAEDARKAFEALRKELPEVAAAANGMEPIKFGGKVSGLGDSIGEEIANSLARRLGEALSGGDIKEVGKGLGADLGSIAGKKIGESVGRVVGESWGKYLGPIGQVLGQELGKSVVKGILHIFGGGKNKDTRARKALDKWLGDQLDGKGFQVVIDGQLKKLNDFNFGGSKAFNKPDWAAYFQGLPGAAQDAFKGVGSVLAEKLNLDPKLIEQFGAVLANNLGGSLNNLGVLMQTLKISAEEAGQIIVQSFEQGNISAAQAEKYIDGVNRAMEKGIPDAFGAWDKAWENMLAAGSKGGMATIDSIRDIASEAKEAGAKTIGDLKAFFQEAVKAGKISQEQMDAFFASLEKRGITTLDQLENASTQTLIGVAADLENNGVLKDMSSVTQQIKDLPDKKVVKIEVQTYFTGDPKAAKALDLKQPVGSSPGVAA